MLPRKCNNVYTLTVDNSFPKILPCKFKPGQFVFLLILSLLSSRSQQFHCSPRLPWVVATTCSHRPTLLTAVRQLSFQWLQGLKDTPSRLHPNTEANCLDQSPEVILVAQGTTSLFILHSIEFSCLSYGNALTSLHFNPGNSLIQDLFQHSNIKEQPWINTKINTKDQMYITCK